VQELSKLAPTLGARLYQARTAANLDFRELAMLAGVNSFQSIHQWETGKARPSIDTVVNLARALSVRPDWLAFGMGASGLDERKAALAHLYRLASRLPHEDVQTLAGLAEEMTLAHNGGVKADGG